MQSKSEIRPLTGLRGLAASWVVMYHVHESDHLHGIWETLARHGYLAVDIFFVLSGFVMALSYQSFFETGFRVRRYGLFLLRRIARVYPLYLLMTLSVAAINIVGLSHSWAPSPKELVGNLLMLQGVGLGSTIDPPAWSVSTEFIVYLFFPLLVITLFRARLWIKAPLIAGCYASMVYLAFFYVTDASRNGPLDIWDTHSIWPLIRCLAGFCIGMAGYNVLRHPSAAYWIGRAPLATIALASMIVLAAFSYTDMAFFLLTPLLVCALASPGKDAACRLLGSGFIVFLGDISYSMYLLHMQCIRIRRLVSDKAGAWVGASAADALALCATYGAIILCSYMLFRFVEQPVRYWIRQCEEPLAKLYRAFIFNQASRLPGL